MGNEYDTRSFSMVEAEEQIIERVKRGESSAFSALYTAYVGKIYRFIALKVSSVQEAEDLTHEVFLKALSNIRKYEKRGASFTSWLYEIARNKVIDHYRTKKVNVGLEVIDAEIVSEDVPLTQTLDNEFQNERVRQAILALPEEYQTVLILRFTEDLSPKEIAKIVGKSEGSIRVTQHRALERLKQLLK